MSSWESKNAVPNGVSEQIKSIDNGLLKKYHPRECQQRGSVGLKLAEPMAPATVCKCLKSLGTQWFRVHRNRGAHWLVRENRGEQTQRWSAMAQVAVSLASVNCKVTDSKPQYRETLLCEKVYFQRIY